MTRWLILTGGLLAWALHFIGVYLIASLGDVMAEADAPPWRGIGGVFSVICLGLAIAVGARAGLALRRSRTDPTETFILQIALAGALVGAVGVAYQTLPLLL